MVGAGRRRKRPRTRQKYNFLPNAGFLFNLSYLFDAAKTYHASQTETKRRSGFRFGFQSEKSPFHGSRYKKSPTYGTERAKKRIPGDRIAGDSGGNPPEGGTAQDASRAVIRRQ
jgi:hypothetical protein